MSLGEQSVRDSARRKGHQLFVHEDGGAFTFSGQIMGKGQVVAQLRKSPRANKSKPHLLAQVWQSFLHNEIEDFLNLKQI